MIVGAVLQSGRFKSADSIYVWEILAGSSVGLLASTNGLPSGKGSITFASLNNQTSVSIVVQWDDSVAQKALKETLNPATVTLTSVL